jgi:hypothetical protein
MKNNLIRRELSPNGRFSVEVSAPTESTPYFLARFQCVDGSCGVFNSENWFGPFPPALPEELTIRWDLPDNVCGLYLGSHCYGLYRAGAQRRRHRGSFRTRPFTDEEIAWFCAKTHVQFRYRHRETSP